MLKQVRVVQKFFKRSGDVLISLAAIVILLLVFAVIIIAIRVSSTGPAVFKQRRTGKNGKPFVFYKFRTMKLDVEPFGLSTKSSQDPRLKKIEKIPAGTFI